MDEAESFPIETYSILPNDLLKDRFNFSSDCKLEISLGKLLMKQDDKFKDFKLTN